MFVVFGVLRTKNLFLSGRMQTRHFCRFRPLFLTGTKPLFPKTTVLTTLKKGDGGKGTAKSTLYDNYDTFSLLATSYDIPPSLLSQKALLMGLFRGAVFHYGGMPENCPLELTGRFPSLMGRFATLMGRLPECLNGPFSLLRMPWKTAHYGKGH